MENKIYVYEFYSMDFGWDIFPTVEETIKKLSDGMDDVKSMLTPSILLDDFLGFRNDAIHAVAMANVTSGIITPIYVMPLIHNHAPIYSLIWKAAKGGWCIAASQERLPWIESLNENSLKLTYSI